MKFDSDYTNLSQGADELSKYNNLYERKEQELREINLKRAKNLEVLVQAKEGEILKLRNELQNTSEEYQKTNEALEETYEKLREYERRFAEVKEVLIMKNEKIEELEKELNNERSLIKVKIDKNKTSEKSLIEKCEALQEENKSLKWKQDQELR